MSSSEDTKLKDKSLDELKAECSKRGLKTSGNKPLLIERLQELFSYEKKYGNEVTRCVCNFTHESGTMISCDKCM